MSKLWNRWVLVRNGGLGVGTRRHAPSSHPGIDMEHPTYGGELPRAPDIAGIPTDPCRILPSVATHST